MFASGPVAIGIISFTVQDKIGRSRGRMPMAERHGACAGSNDKPKRTHPLSGGCRHAANPARPAMGLGRGRLGDYDGGANESAAWPLLGFMIWLARCSELAPGSRPRGICDSRTAAHGAGRTAVRHDQA